MSKEKHEEEIIYQESNRMIYKRVLNKYGDPIYKPAKEEKIFIGEQEYRRGTNEYGDPLYRPLIEGEHLTKEVPPEHLDDEGNDMFALFRERDITLTGSGFDLPTGAYVSGASLCNACVNQQYSNTEDDFVCIKKEVSKEEYESQLITYPYKYDCKYFKSDKSSFVYDLVMKALEEKRKNK